VVVALLVLLLFHLVVVVALERCITRHHIPYLRGHIQSQWVMAALVDHKVELPKMVQTVYSDLLVQMEEATVAMAAATVQVMVVLVVAAGAVKPEGHR
jgi:predicted CDP-diglyceride synthetase/phosphatidate cytidylyltransferase